MVNKTDIDCRGDNNIYFENVCYSVIKKNYKKMEAIKNLAKECSKLNLSLSYIPSVHVEFFYHL